MATKKKMSKKAAAKKARDQLVAVILFSLGALMILLSIVKGSSGWLPIKSCLKSCGDCGNA